MQPGGQCVERKVRADHQLSCLVVKGVRNSSGFLLQPLVQSTQGLSCLPVDGQLANGLPLLPNNSITLLDEPCVDGCGDPIRALF